MQPRSRYASYALEHPDRLKIVAVADPSEPHRRNLAKAHVIPKSRCYGSVAELAAQPAMADAAINGTMDALHVPTSLPLLKAGYDLLLEKPFATGEAEMWQLVEAARRHGRRIMVCHVLRYAPFYRAIRERLETGEIGEIVNIQTNEHVSYHHMAAASGTPTTTWWTTNPSQSRLQTAAPLPTTWSEALRAPCARYTSRER